MTPNERVTEGSFYATVETKDDAVQGGALVAAPYIAAAAAAGWQAACDIVIRDTVAIVDVAGQSEAAISNGKVELHIPRWKNSVLMANDLHQLVVAHEGNVTLAVLAYLVEAEILTAAGPENATYLEVRTWGQQPKER
jgi:hypothetical protein